MINVLNIIKKISSNIIQFYRKTKIATKDPFDIDFYDPKYDIKKNMKIHFPVYLMYMNIAFVAKLTLLSYLTIFVFYIN